jgi:O-antigen ligase
LLHEGSPQGVLIRGGRLYWPGRAVEAAEVDEGEPGRLDRWRNVIVGVTVFLYLLLNWGFQQVRVPPGGGFGLPVGELTLFFVLLTISYNSVLGKLSRSVLLLPFAIWWSFGLGRAVFDAMAYGPWALRDAAHVIESLYLLAGFVFAAHPKTLERFFTWAPRLMVVGVIYALLYPFQWDIMQVSPSVMTPNGWEAPIFGVMTNSAYWAIIAAVYLLLFRGRSFLANLVAVVLLGAVVALYQARMLYLTTFAIFAFLAVYRRSSIPNMALLGYLGAFMLALLAVTDLRIEGRLGTSFSPAFLFAHLKAIFGWCDPTNVELASLCSAAAGVDQRLDWWINIYEKMIANPFFVLLGLGYGEVLTDFYDPGGNPVREPHNSYISIIARTGVIGAIAWLAMMAALFRRWHRITRRCRELGWREGENWMLVIMAFFIALWVFALGEDGFEKPYNIIPFYFLWGVVLRFGMLLDQGRIGPAALGGEPAPYEPKSGWTAARDLRALPPR